MIEEITTLTSNNGSRVWSVDWYGLFLYQAPEIESFGISRRG